MRDRDWLFCAGVFSAFAGLALLVAGSAPVGCTLIGIGFIVLVAGHFDDWPSGGGEAIVDWRMF